MLSRFTESRFEIHHDDQITEPFALFDYSRFVAFLGGNFPTVEDILDAQR